MVEQTATDDAVVSLKRQMAEKDEALATAAEAISKAKQEAEKAVAARVAADVAAINNGIAAAQTALDAAEGRYADALAAGDHVTAAKINREMNEATVTLREYQNRKVNIENWQKRESARIVAEANRPQQQPQHQQVRQFTPATQAWLDKHQIDGQSNTDPKFLKAQAAHFDATAAGLKVDTPEYFAHLDNFIGNSTGQHQNQMPFSNNDAVEIDLDAKTPVHTPQPAPVLTPSRTTPVLEHRSNQVVNGRVRLSAGEIEAAKISNPDLYQRDPDAAIREYARNKALLIQEGRY